jgi:hypothetical protein
MTAQWVGIVWAALVLILVGRFMRGRSMLAATAFGLGLALVVVWLERAGYWPRSWRSPPSWSMPQERPEPVVPQGPDTPSSQRI